MKKIISLVLCAVVVLSLAACGSKKNDVSPANALKAEFVELAKKGDSASAIAANLASNGKLMPFSAGAMDVEPGLLMGFDNYEVKNFKSGAVFMPMIGSIPFIGYVFEAEDAAAAAALATELETNCNPRWNICVAAEETVTAVEGSKVFFCMRPLSFEE